MKKTILIIFLIAVMVVNLGCTRGEMLFPYFPDNSIDWEANGFIKMKTTAYVMGHHTANGSAVHNGGCAASAEHMGDVAILYTLDGTYLGMYECNDTGGTKGIQNGYVIDIYRQNMTQAENYMRITGGKVYVKWVKGAG